MNSVDGVADVDDLREALDLNGQGEEHEGQRAGPTHQTESADHQPSEDEPNCVASHLGRHPSEGLLERLRPRRVGILKNPRRIFTILVTGKKLLVASLNLSFLSGLSSSWDPNLPCLYPFTLNKTVKFIVLSQDILK